MFTPTKKKKKIVSGRRKECQQTDKDNRKPNGKISKTLQQAIRIKIYALPKNMGKGARVRDLLTTAHLLHDAPGPPGEKPDPRASREAGWQPAGERNVNVHVLASGGSVPED